MITFSPDPAVAEKQMNAIIFYMTAFGYIDGDYDASEKGYLKEYVRGLVAHRAAEAMPDAADAALRDDVVSRWTKHFHEVVDDVDHQIQGWFTESVADGETTRQFVLAKLKLRCFELFKSFDEDMRARLLATIDELMHADGVVHPNEMQFRNELYRLLLAPVEIAEDEIEALDAGAVVIGDVKHLPPREPDHPFLRGSEWDYARDPVVFAKQAESDLSLIRRFQQKLDERRASGAGRLRGASSVAAFAGGDPFLDGHVHVLPTKPGKDYELLVIGDLHGCYSCLKAALLQADFFAKVQAHHDDPACNPEMNLVLLGDYIDRGRFSYNGILRTAMQLYLAVPDHVYVLRGNHEYYVELNGRVLAPVRPAEAMTSLQGIAPNEVFAAYMRLFEALPTSLLFDRTIFVHAGIPRDDTIAEKWTGLESLNDPDIRFQMLWSDPSEADHVPEELQKANARFPFGRRQFKSFMARLGCTTMVRGHERIVEGFRAIYDAPDARLLSLFSAGGKTNNDLPETSNYREVTPMALTIRHRDGISELTPFVIEYERYNDPEYNAFFRQNLGA